MVSSIINLVIFYRSVGGVMALSCEIFNHSMEFECQNIDFLRVIFLPEAYPFCDKLKCGRSQILISTIVSKKCSKASLDSRNMVF